MPTFNYCRECTKVQKILMPMLLQGLLQYAQPVGGYRSQALSDKGRHFAPHIVFARQRIWLFVHALPDVQAHHGPESQFVA